MSLQRQWPLVWKAMGKPELVQDTRFIDLESRARNQASLKEIIENWAKKFTSNEELLQVLENLI